MSIVLLIIYNDLQIVYKMLSKRAGKYTYTNLSKQSCIGMKFANVEFAKYVGYDSARFAEITFRTCDTDPNGAQRVVQLFK